MLINYFIIYYLNLYFIYLLLKSLLCFLYILLKFLFIFFVNCIFKKKNVFKIILKEIGLKFICDLFF